jgi:hypothetical protein
MGILVPNVMEEAMIYLFLWRKFHHLPIKKSPKKHGHGNFSQISKNNSHISMKKIMNGQGSLKDSGKFCSFFLLK